MAASQLAVIAIVLAAIALVLLIALGVQSRSAQRRTTVLLAEFEQRLTHSDEQLRSFEHQLDEKQSRSMVQGRHLQQLQSELEALQNQLQEVKLQDPSMRLYQRAAELVKQGASIDEVIEACDIPRAEAELMMTIHRGPAPE